MKEIKELSILKVNQLGSSEMSDSIAIEEPLEIRLSSKKVEKTVSITMRTPGSDFDLAIGFLFTEGIIESFEDVLEVKHCGNKEAQNIVRVFLKEDIVINMPSLERHFYTSSSCGVCGKTSIEALKTQNSFRDLKNEGPRIPSQILHKLPEKLNQAQEVFSQTGGLHGSALFSSVGKLILLREDVGRHNALDKLIGACLREKTKLPLDNNILLLSGRISFELVQKAAMAGITIIAAIGAPSSLAIELAEDLNITLVGFLRTSKMNIYSGRQRLMINELENSGREAREY